MNGFNIAIAAIPVLLSGSAMAEDSICAPMQREYVALLRQARPNSAALIAQQLATAKANAESGNCNRFLFFGPPKSAACPSIEARVAELEQQLGTSGNAPPLSPELQKASLRAALRENECSVPALSTPGRTLCARACDGYYFPISDSISSSHVKADTAACQAMYGASGLATLFLQRSDDVADARSIDGKRYGDQAFAFRYRDTFNAACHAELKDGMAALEAKAPPAGISPVAAAPDTPPSGQTALQAITEALPVGDPRQVRFVGDSYYQKLFAYTGQ